MSDLKAFIILWLVSGIFSYGINFADFMREFPGDEKHYWTYMFGSMFLGFAYGFPGLIISLCLLRWWKNGLKFW